MTKVDLEKTIMDKVKTREISMKPRWYFAAGSALMVTGLTALSIGAAFLINVTVFLIRRHGPMGQWRLQMMLQSFPWWIPVLAAAGIGAGIWLLRKYDFSYKKNFLMIVLGFVTALILAGAVIDRLGLNEVWFQRGPMRRFYQQIEEQNQNFFPGQGRMYNGGRGGWGRTGQ